MPLTSPGGARYRLVVALLMILGVFCLLRCTHGDVTERKDEAQHRRYAICFYGILRSMDIVLPTIEHHIFDAIKKAGDEYDVFVHTYSMETYYNPRAKEKKMAYTHNDDFKPLQPTRFLVTNQDDFDKRLMGNSEFDIYSKRYEYYHNTLQNVFRARHSLALSWEIMAEYSSAEGVKYDGVIAVRSDVVYLSDIDIARRDLPEDTVYVPTWFSWGGINDRFAFGHMDAMRVYMNRDEPIEPFSKKRLNDEKYLKFHMGVGRRKTRATDMYIIRVRMDGSVFKKDVEMYKRLCYSDSPPFGCAIVRSSTNLRL